MKQSKSSEKSGGTPGKGKSKGTKKDQSLPESEIVARWNRGQLSPTNACGPKLTIQKSETSALSVPRRESGNVGEGG